MNIYHIYYLFNITLLMVLYEYFQIIIMNSMLGDQMGKHGIVGECYGKHET